MIQIRRNVFETNSSSTHSLAYKISTNTGKPFKSKINYDIQLDDSYGDDPENGILAVHFGGYGWQGDPCDNFRSKLAYLMTQLVAGIGMHYYGNNYDELDKRIEGVDGIDIHNQEEWDNVINTYVVNQPNIAKVLTFIKEKCPNINGFKFYWYNPAYNWELEDDYRHYYNLRYGAEVNYDLTDKFFNDWQSAFGGQKYVIGFGDIDHQSAGLLYNIDKYLDKYLFDNNLEVIITNDNR